MESLTYLKNLDIPPKKLRMYLGKIKVLSPIEATNLLYYAANRPAQVFYKAIKSAIANAKQTLKVNDDLLQFKLFTVEEGNKLKRYRPGSRGSAKPFKKRYSHIKIILTAKAEAVEPLKAVETKEPKQPAVQEAASVVEAKKPEVKAKAVKVETKKKVSKKVESK